MQPDYEQHLVNAKAAAQAMVDDVAEAATLAERARCIRVLRNKAAGYTPGGYQWHQYLKAAAALEVP